MARRAHNQVTTVRPEEQALLQAIVSNPGDEGLWLILADWLEEHDDPRRAEVLCLHRQLIASCCEPEKHPERAGQQARIVQMLTQGVRPSVPRQTLPLAGGVEMTFAWIPPGSFLMGSPESEDKRAGDETQHKVTLTRGLWLGVTPVTQAQWRAAVPDSFIVEDEGLPVRTASWHQCQKLCRGLQAKVGSAFRLPSEAEWEYACRAGTTTPFFCGETLSTEQANFNGKQPYGGAPKGVSREQTTPVGSFPCNAWGLFDMHGNVWEWCQDGCGEYGEGPVRDPKGPVADGPCARILRGGCWYSSASYCRSAFRYGTDPLRCVRYGCRVVLCLD